MKKTYTVIGHYDDSEQNFLGEIKASSGQAAMDIAAYESPTLTVICALPGIHKEGEQGVTFSSDFGV